MSNGTILAILEHQINSKMKSNINTGCVEKKLTPLLTILLVTMLTFSVEYLVTLSG